MTWKTTRKVEGSFLSSILLPEGDEGVVGRDATCTSPHRHLRTLSKVAIICLGNRWMDTDDLGLRVFDVLTHTNPPCDVIDGGLCGLDLLREIEGRRRVVFVDAIIGDTVEVMTATQVAGYAKAYGHGAGLPYLLQMAPCACPTPLPNMVLIGGPGNGDEQTVQTVARKALEVAIHGVF